MAGKVEYLDKQRSLHPELSDELLELAWHLQDVEKAQQYGAILNTCTSYSEIVERVLHPMYVCGEVNALKAKKRIFSRLLGHLGLFGETGQRPCRRASCETDARRSKDQERATTVRGALQNEALAIPG